MTGKRNYFLPHSKLQQEWESPARTTQLNAESERRAIRKLQDYRRPLPPRESDLAMWTTNEWMT